ncbi:unnamed protein product, partial [Sphacelaria rigidula]
TNSTIRKRIFKGRNVAASPEPETSSNFRQVSGAIPATPAPVSLARMAPGTAPAGATTGVATGAGIPDPTPQCAGGSFFPGWAIPTSTSTERLWANPGSEFGVVGG